MNKLNKLNRILLSGLLFSLSLSSFSDEVRSDFDVDDDGLIEINDINDLNEIRNSSNGRSLYGQSTGCPVDGCFGFELTSDLDFDSNGDGKFDSLDDFWNQGEGWIPLPLNSGLSVVFDGNGHSISNLYMNRNATNSGLFGRVYLAEIRNLNIASSVIASTQGNVGSLAGYFRNSKVVGGSFSGILDCSQGHLGGVVGYSQDSIISDVEFSGALSGNLATGGVAGYILGTDISQAFSSGHLDAAGTGSGGIVGRISELSSITDSSTSMSISGTGTVGGLVGGINHSTTISDSYAVGNVTGTLGNVGGLIGSASGVTILTSYATGNVTASGSLNGGLVGYIGNSSVKESYATGHVTGLYRVGGLIGYSSNTQVSYSFSIGNVYVTDPDDVPSSSTNGYSGGFVGVAQNTDIVACYSTGSVLDGVGTIGIDSYAGSFVGELMSDSSIRGSYSVGTAFDEDLHDSGLTGWDDQGVWDVEATYWLADTTPLSIGYTLVQLQCPIAENSTSCSGLSAVLYENWGSYTYQDEQGVNIPYWDFGTSSQLPGLNINGVVYRDSDANGVLDMNQISN